MLEAQPKLLQPRDHKAKVSIWSDLTLADMDKLDEAVTVDQLKLDLAEIFNVKDYNQNLKSGILIDLYYYTIQFSRDNNFSKEQTSAFFSIVKKTHDVCIETPFGNVEQCFNFFREMVLCHAVKRPPFSIDLFSAEEVRKITDYVINTYFRHYKMYKYTFTPLVRLDLSMNYVGMPPTPVPSEAGDAVVDEAGVTDPEAPNDDVSQPGNDDKQEAEQTKEESPEAKELRALIREHLSDEIKKLKISVEDQIKESEQNLVKKLATIEGSSSTKGARGSAKRKK